MFKRRASSTSRGPGSIAHADVPGEKETALRGNLNSLSSWGGIAVSVAALVPVLLIGFGVTALADTASGASTNPASGAATNPAAPGDPAKGGQLYTSSGCAGCHGANLDGGVGPKLNPIVAFSGVHDPLDPGYLVQTITNGRSGDAGYSIAMPAKGGRADLTAQDIQDMAAFIISENHKGGAGLSPTELARSTVFWVGVGVLGMVLVAWLLAVYNMRWIARRAQARSGGA